MWLFKKNSAVLACILAVALPGYAARAQAVDIARNLMAPVEEMGLSISIDTRTADTSTAKRKQQSHPPTSSTR